MYHDRGMEFTYAAICNFASFTASLVDIRRPARRLRGLSHVFVFFTRAVQQDGGTAEVTASHLLLCFYWFWILGNGVSVAHKRALWDAQSCDSETFINVTYTPAKATLNDGCGRTGWGYSTLL